MTELFPGVGSPEAPASCGWCDEPATHEIEVRPVSHTTRGNGVRVVRQRPLMAGACEHHFNTIERTA